MNAPLLALTASKTVANTALRWIAPFLPTLERAFGTSIGTLTSVMAVAEVGGLSTLVSGPVLDRGHRRRLFLAGAVAVTLSAMIALGGSVHWFALSFAVLILGVTNLTVAGLAWLSARVPYERRARSIGIFELSWALALLIGGPLIALLIGWFGWRGPFVALAVAGALTTVVVALVVPPDDVPRAGLVRRHPRRPSEQSTPALPRTAWAPLFASAITAAAGLSVFVVSGAWLTDRYGFTTAGLGLAVTAFGLLELLASGSSAAFADRLGKRRSVAVGLATMGGGLLIAASAGASAPVAVVGLVVFLAGFEFGFVTSLSLVSEAAPAARGRALGVGNSIGTLTRAAAVFSSGQLYQAHGMGATFALSAGLVLVAVALLTAGPA